MKSNKLTKNVLKEIVKECLIEILAEGLTSDSNQNVETGRRKSRTLKESLINAKESQVTSKGAKKPSYLDSIDFSNKKEKNNKLDEIASSITKDPILTEMLTDTAHTTLQEQIAAESKRNHVPAGRGDDAQRMVESSTPENIFGEETSSKWAHLAFGG